MYQNIKGDHSQTSYIWQKLIFCNTTTLIMTKFYRGKFDPWLWSMISTLYYIWPLKLTYSTCEKIKSQYCILIKYLKLYGQRCSFLKPYRKTNQKDKKQCISRLWFLKNCLVWSQILRYMYVLLSWDLTEFFNFFFEKSEPDHQLCRT